MTGFAGNTADLSELTDKLAHQFEAKARIRATNRTRDSVQSKTRKALTARGIPAKAVANKRVFKGKSATAKRPIAVMKIGTWVVPVERFGNPRGLKKGGVTYMTAQGRKNDPHAFFIPAKKGGELASGVLNRVGRDRLPIKKKTEDLYAVAQGALETTVSETVVHEIFEKEFRSNLNWRVEQEVKKWRRAG